MRGAHWRKRKEILELLARKCVGCGISDPPILQIDHINGGVFKN